MTKEENHLWYDFLRQLPQTFRRQKVIGRYVVDFYCAEAKIAIELDGSQHGSPEGVINDRIRDEYLLEQGVTVLRYTNTSVHQNFRGVCQDILEHLNTSSASHSSAPSPQGEG
jgi:very-short-patch-repair endonuclease